MHAPPLRRLLVAATVSAAALGAVPAAQAQTSTRVAIDDTGRTTLTLDPGAAAALRGLGVSVAPLSPARASSAGIGFPITGGRVDPGDATGQVTHRGGLRLRAGRVRVDLRNPTITTIGSTRTLSVQAGGRRFHAFTLDLGRVGLVRNGLGATVTGVRVRLSLKGAAALNRAFGTRALRRGLLIGTASFSVSPTEVAFTSGRTELALDSGAAAALQSLGISISPTQAASVTEGGAIAFPITRGRVVVATLAGQVNHDGGILLRRGSTQIEVADPIVDTTGPVLTAGSALGRIPLADLDLSAAAPSIAGRDVTVGGVGVLLSQPAADALNQTFGTTAFRGGLRLGTATVFGQAR